MEMEDWIEEYDAEGASLLLNGRKVGMLFFEASFRTQVEGSIFHRQKKQIARLGWMVAISREGRLHFDNGLYCSQIEARHLDEDVFIYEGIEYAIDWLPLEEIEDARMDFCQKHDQQIDGDFWRRV